MGPRFGRILGMGKRYVCPEMSTLICDKVVLLNGSPNPLDDDANSIYPVLSREIVDLL